MLTGNTRVLLKSYETPEDACEIIDSFLANAPPPSAAAAAGTYWVTTNVQHLLNLEEFKGEILSFRATDSVGSVLARLSEINVLSAPIYDETTNKCLGLVDKMDIVSYLLSHVDHDEGFALQLQSLGHKRGALSNPVRLAINHSRHNPFLPVTAATPLRDVISTLAEGVHRVPVMNEEGRVVSVLSQLTVGKMLLRNPEVWAYASGRTVEQALGGKPRHKTLLSVTKESTMMEAYQIITDKGIGGLPVVDGAGRLVSSVSPKDLKNLKQIQWLLETVDSYMAQYPRFTADCRPTDTLLSVVSVMTPNRIHRAYLVDANHVPYSIISFTDIMRQLLV